jgi:hypothetical protein
MHVTIDNMSHSGWRGSLVVTAVALALILSQGISLAAAKKGSMPTLEQFTANKHIKIYPKVYSGVRQKEYSVFSCKGQVGGNSSMGLIMRFKPAPKSSPSFSAYYANMYSQMDRALKAWEPTMFNDLSPLFFAGKKISQVPIFQSTKYTTENGAATIDVRFGKAKSDDGTELSIYYAVYAEDVYIFNDSKCLSKALDKHQPVLEP